MPNREAEDSIKSSMPQPDTEAAIAFLKRWRPSGVLTLAAIEPDGPIETKSWRIDRPTVWDQITRWIAKWQGKRNLYFTANETRPIDKKPTKQDVTHIRANFTDADPDTSEGYAIGRARLLDEMLPRFIGGDLPATVTIDSGNGLQGLWQGEDGEPVTEGTIEAFEAINKPFSEAMGSKGIFNVDRLLRLPGTINLPNQAKLSKGYPAEPTLARLIHSSGVRYTADQIKAWTEKAVAAERARVEAEAKRQQQERQQGQQQDHQLAGLPEALRTRFAAHLKSDPILGRRWRGDTTGLNDTTRSGVDMSLGAQLKKRGYTFNEMTSILRIFPHGAGSEKDDRYFSRIWEHTGQQQDKPAPEQPAVALDLRGFKATDLNNIPPRPWLLGTTALRGAVTAVSAPGGTSKSTLELERCVSLATGIPITGEQVYERVRVWYLSAEDPREEVMRRIKAICLKFSIDPSLLEGWLFVHDLSDGPIKLAVRAETRIVHPDTPRLAATLDEYKIGYVVLDPLVSFHELNENDNVEMALVIRALSGVAQQTGVAIKIVAHARKGHLAGDADAMRGGSAIRDGCRSVETLTTMTEEEAKDLNIEAGDRRWLVRLDDAKANFAAPLEQVTWLRRESVDLGNSDGIRPSDKVGVLRPVDISDKAGEARRQAASRHEQEIAAVAELVAGAIAGSGGTEMLLKDVAADIEGDLRLKPSAVRSRISAAIPIAPKGRDLIIQGEHVRLWIRRNGSHQTAPQTIVRQVIDDQAGPHE
jgi:hypothetical protein